MSPLSRTVRSSPRSGVSVHDLLGAVLVSELLDPSPHLWLVSPWVSDVVVVDNRDDRFGAVLGDSLARGVHLSEVLAGLARGGAEIHVAVRPDDHNRRFLDRLEAAHPGPVDVHRGEDLHEKTMCGRDWLITGSMNFTWNGLENNDEAVTLSVDEGLAARTRIDFGQRWES